MSDTPAPEESDSPFTEEEQLTLTMLPSLVGSAIAFSAKSGPVGTMKEMLANAKAAVAGFNDFPDNSVIRSVLPNLDDREAAMENAKAMREQQLERLKSSGIETMEDMRAKALADAAVVKDLLASKADSAEAAEYKQWVMGIADSVAQAAKEGGFLGIGGERVSDEEKAVIADVADALGANDA